MLQKGALETRGTVKTELKIWYPLLPYEPGKVNFIAENAIYPF